MSLTEILCGILKDFAVGEDICWGLQVIRKLPNGNSTIDYLVPNTIRNWHDYAEAQPEFQKLPKSKKPQLEKIKWVKAEIRASKNYQWYPLFIYQCLFITSIPRSRDLTSSKYSSLESTMGMFPNYNI